MKSAIRRPSARGFGGGGGWCVVGVCVRVWRGSRIILCTLTVARINTKAHDRTDGDGREWTRRANQRLRRIHPMCVLHLSRSARWVPSPPCDVHKCGPLPPATSGERWQIKRGDETVREGGGGEHRETEGRGNRRGKTTAPCLTSRCLALTASEMFFLRACHGTSGRAMRDKLRRRGRV